MYAFIDKIHQQFFFFLKLTEAKYDSVSFIKLGLKKKLNISQLSVSEILNMGGGGGGSLQDLSGIPYRGLIIVKLNGGCNHKTKSTHSNLCANVHSQHHNQMLQNPRHVYGQYENTKSIKFTKSITTKGIVEIPVFTSITQPSKL